MNAMETENLSIGYQIHKSQTAVVHGGLDLNLKFGELTCLLGRNGSGKSTLLKTVCGFIPPLEGTVVINGKEIHSFTPEEFARTVGVVLTDKTDAGGFSVKELVSLGRYPYTGYFGNLSEKDVEVVSQSMNDVGISHKADCYVSDLSDGERQKAFIAKALAQECPIIVLDEPTSFLDIVSKIDVFVLLKRIANKHEKAILVSTHDLETAIRLADTLWLLPEGIDENVITGTPKDIISNGKMEKLFNFETDLQKTRILNEVLNFAD